VVVSCRGQPAGVFCRGLNAQYRSPDAKRTDSLLVASFTHDRLWLAFIICWKGTKYNICSPFQQIKANHKQTQVNLSKVQANSALGVHGGEMVSWWRVGWWQNSLVAR